MSRCVADPSSLAERELRALGELLSSIARKRGAPGSTEHSALRATQSAVAALPTHDAFARVLVDRLAPFPLDGGIASPPGSVEDFLLWAEEHLAEPGGATERKNTIWRHA